MKIMKSSIIDDDIKNDILPKFSREFKALEDLNLLVTGGNGFLGGYIVDTLVEYNKMSNAPCRINVITREPLDAKSRLSHLLDDPNVNFIVADVGKTFNIPKGVDAIVHAASKANPKAFL